MTVLDREQLRGITMDDEELMREVLSALIDDTSRQMGSLERAILRADAGETMRLAHYVKGACANVGAESAAALFKEIERTAARGDFAACTAALPVLTAELEKLRAAAVTI